MCCEMLEEPNLINLTLIMNEKKFSESKILDFVNQLKTTLILFITNSFITFKTEGYVFYRRLHTSMLSTSVKLH